MANNEILSFINRRFPENNGNWTNGNCYWFAHILNGRFPEGEIWYEPVVGHFIFKYGDHFYDWTGEYLEDTSRAVPFNEEYDSSWYKRLIRDCVN